jgi:nitroreductase
MIDRQIRHIEILRSKRMVVKELTREFLRDAVELAGRAPSVHNSQPWRFRLDDQRVDLFADYSRWLPTTDADGRDVLLSCGAALHHLRLALEGAGAGVSVHRLPDPENPNHLATLHVGDAEPATAGSELLDAIQRRRTDRRPFSHWPMPEQFLRSLQQAAADQGAVLRKVDDPGATTALLEAIELAALTQDGTPGYLEELASWAGRTGADGIPRSSLLRTQGTRVAAARAFPGGDVASVDGGQQEEATLMVLGTASDDSLSRLRAGEALSAVLLEATRHNLTTCPLSQPLEVAATREIVQDKVLGGTLSPQIVLRLGWGPANSPLPSTPRRPVDQVID